MDKLEQQISDLETTLKGMSHDDESKKMARMSIVKQAAQDMTDEEKKEARKAFDMEEEKKDSKKSNTDDMDKKDSKKSNTDDMDKKDSKKSNTDDMDKKDSKKSNEDYDEMKKSNMEQKEKIASLTASVNYLTAKPYVEKMLTARRKAGMSEDKLNEFKNSLYGKSVKEIKQRFEEDSVLYKKPLIAQTTIGEDIPFNGDDDIFDSSLSASTEEKTLEEMFD